MWGRFVGVLVIGVFMVKLKRNNVGVVFWNLMFELFVVYFVYFMICYVVLYIIMKGGRGIRDLFGIIMRDWCLV